MKSATPIVMSPQACALGLGAIRDTVVPNHGALEGEDSVSEYAAASGYLRVVRFQADILGVAGAADEKHEVGRRVRWL